MPEKKGMFWLLRKLVTIGVIVGLIWVILQLDYHGRPVKDRLGTLCRTPLVQEIGRRIKGAVGGYLKKDLKGESGPAMEELEPGDREKLKQVIEEESGKK